jgi:hypothetical protein
MHAGRLTLSVQAVRAVVCAEIQDSAASDAALAVLDAWSATHPGQPLSIRRLDRFQHRLAGDQSAIDQRIAAWEAKHHRPNSTLVARQGELMRQWLGATRLRDLLGVHAGLGDLQQLALASRLRG